MLTEYVGLSRSITALQLCTERDVADVVSSPGVSVLQFQRRFSMTEQYLWCLLILSTSFFELLQHEH